MVYKADWSEPLSFFYSETTGFTQAQNGNCPCKSKLTNQCVIIIQETISPFRYPGFSDTKLFVQRLSIVVREKLENFVFPLFGREICAWHYGKQGRERIFGGKMRHKCAELFCPGSFGVSFSVLIRVPRRHFTHSVARAFRFPVHVPRGKREGPLVGQRSCHQWSTLSENAADCSFQLGDS